MKRIIIILFIFSSFIGISQNDTIITHDNTLLRGELKEMDQGVLTLETSYSDSDFKIEWLKVKQVISKQSFRIVLSNGNRYFGTISKDTIENKLIIHEIESGLHTTEIKDIVYFKKVDEGKILDIMNLSFDMGYSYTKTNNIHQFNSALNADYYRNMWGVAINASAIKNLQDDAPRTDRYTGSIDFKLFLRNDFFSSAIADYYSNTEQQLRLRSTYNLSAGQYIIHTNRVYFNYSLGLAYTNENYVEGFENKKSLEGSVKVEYNMFDLGDLNMFTSITVYPSFTESGRWRMGSKLNIKYDLPRDFYIKGTYDYNLDNKPVEGASESDYVITFGLGWEL